MRVNSRYRSGSLQRLSRALILLLTLGAGGAGVFEASGQCTDPPANMAGWWPGEGDANDIQGNNHGVLQNGVTFAGGKVGQAFSFDGVDAYVDLGDRLDRGASDFTLEAWIKGDPSMNAWARIFDKGFASGYSFHKVAASNKVGFEFLASGSQGNGFSTTTDVIDNTWHHVAVVKQGNTATIYADGVAENSETVSTAAQENTLPLLIGFNPGEGLQGYWKGEIDEPTIYDRALSAQEIQAIFASGSAGKCQTAPGCVPAPPNMVSWHQGNGNANDNQGNNHGTLQNGATFGVGKVGQAFSFDGNDDKVTVPNSASLNITGNQLTLDAWVRPSATNSHRQVVSKASGLTEPEHQYGFYVTVDNRLGFGLVTTAGRVDVAAGSVPNDVFTHIAVTYDGSAMKFYIDGIFVHTQPHSGTIASNTGDLAIGQFSVAGAFPFKGLIDEVEIFNRTLTQAEIQAIFNAGSAGKCKSVGPTPTPTASPTATVSPGSGQIVFERAATGAPTTANIWLMNQDGSNQVQITSTPANLGPKWSPDGTRIVFMSTRDGNFEIYVMNADGTNQVRLTNNSVLDGFPAWSPDGTKIVFAADPGEGASNQSDIYVMNADGSNRQRLTTSLGLDLDPAWSPNGTKIAFSRDGEIYVMNPDGTNATRFTFNSGPDRLPAWSPDGTKIAFATGATTGGVTTNIAVMNANGTNVTMLTNFQNGTAQAAAWSPDGSRISFSSNANNTSSTQVDIYLINPDGSNLTRITNAPGDDLTSHWKPVAQPATTTLANVSTRLPVGTGDNALIGGFIVTGTQPKKVIIRAIAPSLGIPGQLSNPTLELFAGQTSLGFNDDWQNSSPADKQAILDSTIPPGNNLEAAIVRTLPANGTGYTAVVRGVNNTTGIAVVEVYDLDRSVNSKLANISTRGLVQTGNNVLIAGTIVIGQGSQKVIVRGIGPSLSVPGKLLDPTLEMRDSNGTLLEGNDNWQDSTNEQAIIDSTIPPTNPSESAIVRTLAPGSYTAILRGVNDTTGIAVVEVYALN